MPEEEKDEGPTDLYTLVMENKYRMLKAWDSRPLTAKQRRKFQVMRAAGRTCEEMGAAFKMPADVIRANIYIDTFRDNTKEGKALKARLEKEKAANMRKNGPVFGYNPL